MTVYIKYAHGNKEHRVQNITALELSADIDTPCDSLRMYYITAQAPQSIVSVRAENDRGKNIFTGFADVQSVSACDGGCKCFIYARSSASLLLDNECEPSTIYCPSSSQLFADYAREFNYINKLPKIAQKCYYQVSRGISRYSAINSFIKSQTGSNIYVNADNELTVHSVTQDAYSLNRYNIISFDSSINRCGVISKINYKNDTSEAFCRHAINKKARSLGIKRERYISQSSIPQWQRENNIDNMLTESCMNYKTLVVKISGECDLPLSCLCSYSNKITGCLDDMILRSKSIQYDKNGVVTILKLGQRSNEGLVHYVD